MDNLKVELRESKFGKGVFAKSKINAGEIISEFEGSIYTDENVVSNVPANGQKDWTEHLNDHCIQFEDGKWKYATNLAIYLNHSCEPNCGIKNLFQIVAMRDIEVDEEITWDYEMSEDNDTENPDSFYYWVLNCNCGAENCRKKIGSYKNLPLENRQKYKGFISEWLIKKYGEND